MNHDYRRLKTMTPARGSPRIPRARLVILMHRQIGCCESVLGYLQSPTRDARKLCVYLLASWFEKVFSRFSSRCSFSSFIYCINCCYFHLSGYNESSISFWRDYWSDIVAISYWKYYIFFIVVIFDSKPRYFTLFKLFKKLSYSKATIVDRIILLNYFWRKKVF